MKTITYMINGRTAALEADRLYRRLIDGRLTVRIADGRLRDASPEEIVASAQLGGMAAAVQLGGMAMAESGEAQPTPPPATPDFAAMSKTELEVWARDRHGVNLDRRKRKETLIEEARALAII